MPNYTKNASLGGYSMICPGTGILSQPTSGTLSGWTWYSPTSEGAVQYLVDQRESYRQLLHERGYTPEQAQAHLNSLRWDLLPDGSRYHDRYGEPPGHLRLTDHIVDPEELIPEALRVHPQSGTVVKKTRATYTLDKPRFAADGLDSTTITFSNFLTPFQVAIFPGKAFQLTSADYTIICRSEVPQRFRIQSEDPENWFPPFYIEAR